MNILSRRTGNKRGIVLISAYLVVLILMVLSSVFFMRVIQEKKAITYSNDYLKALYNAEKGVAFAYFESAAVGWQWYTHIWSGNNLVPNNPSFLRINECELTPDGYYAEKNGTFILRAYPDPKIDDVTIVRVKGISGQIERIIEYRIAQSSIYDFAWWTPYDLNINDIGGRWNQVAYVNGGRIHANGNISISNYAGDEFSGTLYGKRLLGVDTISTGNGKGVSYANTGNYINPGYFDYYVDGSGTSSWQSVPAADLGLADVSLSKFYWNDTSMTVRRWAGTNSSMPLSQQLPWNYEDTSDYNKWKWKESSYGPAYLGWSNYYSSGWPPSYWLNTEYYFSGSSDSRYIGSNGLNNANLWVAPAIKDSNGDIQFYPNGTIKYDPYQEIPSEIPGALWNWNKYSSWGYSPGANPLNFTVYDQTINGTIDAKNSYWKIDLNTTRKVVMVNSTEPGALNYWQMLQNPNYWQVMGFSSANALSLATHINPEVSDGTYGSEIRSQVNYYNYTYNNVTYYYNYTSTSTTPTYVNYTNSSAQAVGWNQMLQSRGLEDVVMANEKGENMEAPRFATTYKQKSQQSGLYLSRKGGNQTLHYPDATKAYTAYNCSDYRFNSGSVNASLAAYSACMENSIDVLVEALNTDSEGEPLHEHEQIARKVSFINTISNQTQVVLELDLDRMQRAGIFPANGIIYSEVPIRLADASELPHKGSSSNSTFNVIGEENIYLKGDYNSKASDWMTSAVISKKQIYTLSEDFNDPKVPPAFVAYPNYPYVYLQGDSSGPLLDGSGNIIEGDPKAGNGRWWHYGDFVYRSSLYNQTVVLRDNVQADWAGTFDKRDHTGSSTYTVSSSHPWINGQEWGAMPNRVQHDQTYNALMASYYNGGYDGSGIPYGTALERWYDDHGSTRYSRMNGAFFQLDKNTTDPDNFAALQTEGPVDFISGYGAPFNFRNSQVYSHQYYILCGYTNGMSNPIASYDARFRNKNLAKNRPIFFGGGTPSWREIPLSNFTTD